MNLLLIILYFLIINPRITGLVDALLTSSQLNIPDRLLTKIIWIPFLAFIFLFAIYKTGIKEFISKILKSKDLIIAIIIVFLSSTISSIFALSISESFSGVIYYILLFGLFLLVTIFWNSKLKAMFLKVQTIFAFLLLIIGIVQIIAMNQGAVNNPVIQFFDNYGGFMPISFYLYDSEFGGGLRPSSLMIDPNFLGILAVLQILYAVYELRNKWNLLIKKDLLQIQNYIYEIFMILIGVGLVVITNSRTAILMLISAILFQLFIFLISKLKNRIMPIKKNINSIFIPVLSFAFIDQYITPFFDRLVSAVTLSDGSTQSRLGYAKIAIDAFISQPITGVGIGCFGIYYSNNIEIGATATNPHSFYFRILSELGILGILAWIYFFYVYIKHIVSSKKWFLLVILVAIFSGNLVYDFMMTPWLWFYLGIIWAEASRTES